MKKLISVLFCIMIFTACGNDNSAKSNSNTAEMATEKTTEFKQENDENICSWENDVIIHENINDFMAATSKARTLSPLIPEYDKSKYEITKVLQSEISYTYHFKNLSNENTFQVCVNHDASYHTFEEMVKTVNLNHVLEVENIETIVWGDTPALVQSVQFSDPK